MVKKDLTSTTGVAALAAVLTLTLFIACSRQPSYPPAAVKGADIIIDPASLDPDTPKFYTYQYQGKNINYFVLKVQGKVFSFLDACASCYPHKQGYRCDDGSVTCRYCGLRFSVYKLEKGLGSCYPIKLEGKMAEGKYRIPVSELESAVDKF